ncbi:MAG: ATP-binding protein, partial [Bacteroidota bacterium]
MDYREVKRLAQQGEGTHIEFKQKVYYPHKILREIVAFANTEGGYLLIGVTDDGQLKGVKNPDGEIFELERFMKKYCVPYPDYDTYRIELRDERVVVVFDIKEHAPKPMYLMPKGEPTNKDGRIAYVRLEDKSVQASREMKRIMRDSSNNRKVT